MWLPDFLLPHPDISVYTVAGTAMLTIINSLLLMAITWRTNITRSRSSLPIILYLSLTSSITTLHTDWRSQLVVVAVQLTLLLTLSTYHREHAVEEAFLSTLLICTSALIMPDILCLIPIVWLLFIIQRALTIRTWLASLTGGAIVAIYATLLHYTGLIRIGTFSELTARQSIVEWNLRQWFVAIFIIAEGIFTIICILTRLTQENSHIRSYITCISIPFLLTSILIFFPPLYFPSLLAISVYLLANLYTWFFYSRNSVFAGIVFLLHTTIWIGLWFLETVTHFH